jgi:TonB family protein
LALLDEQIDGKYEILAKLREGGMGAIYKVRHRLLDEVRVVKVIRAQVERSSDSSDRFLREAQAAIKLRHPNIAVLFDFAVAPDGQAFIVMEFIAGWNLQELLLGYGPPPLGLTLEIARQSLKALGYLHRQRIVHRDVSPDNLMVTRDVDGGLLVKLIDLGIAKNLEGAGGLTTTGVFLGKPRYGSPERFTGEGWDQRSDLYSFGVVLYELLTGRAPITGNDAASQMAGHLFRPPLPFAETDPAERVPPDVRAIVLRALAKRAEERYASAEELGAALAAVQERCPPDRGDLEAVWTVLEPIDPRFGGAANPLGSTQFRLDQEFGLQQTPTRLVPGDERKLTLAPAVEGPAAERTQPIPTAASASDPRLPPAEPEGTRRTVPPAVGPEAGPGLPFERAAAGSVGSDDLDATWARRPFRREPALRSAETTATPAAARTRAAVAGSGRRRSFLAFFLTTGLALLAGGGWLWRADLRRFVDAARRGPAPTSDAPGQVAVPTEAIPADSTALPTQPGSSQEGGSAPGSAPSVAGARAAPRASVGSSSSASAGGAAAPPRPAAPVRKRTPHTAPEPMGPVLVPPMHPGDLILGSQPQVEEPEVRVLATPAYPTAAKGKEMSPIVRVRVLVDENGRVIDRKILRPDPSGFGFNEAAFEAAGRTTFLPGTRDGIPGRMWTEVEFRFEESRNSR